MRRKISFACGPATRLIYHGYRLATHRSHIICNAQNEIFDCLYFMACEVA
jgi:hypothetical protein